MTVLRRVILRGTVVFLYNDVTIRDSIARTANEYVYTLLRRSLPQGAAVYRTDSENEYSRGNTLFWEQRKLEQIADRFDNLRVPVTANMRIPGDTPYYGANGIQDYVSGFTHEGEFVLVAEDGANDLKNYPVQYVNGRIWVNNHAHVLQGKDQIANNLFLSYSIHRADIESLLVGGGRAKLNAETMMKIELLVPTLSEQEKIGAYFSRLDNLITLHQREAMNKGHDNI